MRQRSVDLRQYQPEGIDVGTRIDLCVIVELLRRGITPRACRLLEHGEIVGIRQPEIDQLDMTAVVGQHDVSGFQVPVDCLPAMDVGQGLTQFVCHPRRIGK